MEENMKELSFRFIVVDEGINVKFVQASPTEVVFEVYREDTTTTVEPNVNVSEEETLDVSETITQKEEAITETTKKSSRHRIDKELFDKLWNAGVSGDVMAEQLGVTKNSVYSYAYKHGYGKRNNKEVKTERFIEMWNSGCAVADIADAFNICISSVYRWASQLPECIPGSERPSGTKTSYKRIRAKQLVPDKLAGKMERFVEMWNDCVPIATITDEFKVSVATVCRWASEIPECISSEEKKKKRAAMKQSMPIDTDNAAVQTVSSKEDYPKTGEHLRENEIKALCKMWRNGQQNVAYLAKYFSVSKSTIYRQLRINGCRR